jgi:hypothetical protein
MPATSEQLRHDIDAGRTGDKVSAPDPAMAPLGTDDEAGGRPASPHDVALARRQELQGPDAEIGESHTTWFVVIAVALVFAVALVAGFALH